MVNVKNGKDIGRKAVYLPGLTFSSETAEYTWADIDAPLSWLLHSFHMPTYYLSSFSLEHASTYTFLPEVAPSQDSCETRASSEGTAANQH